MDPAPRIASTLQQWLAGFTAASCAASPSRGNLPADPQITIPALAALAAEALARQRTLWIISADDMPLADISNALDLRLRPLCLVLPGAEHACRVTLRATLSLLKSRLTRAASDSEGPAWALMRARLLEEDELWRASLDWLARGLDSEAPPARIGSLFPVRIGPWTQALQLATAADWVMLMQPRPVGSDEAWLKRSRIICLQGAATTPAAAALTRIDSRARLRAETEILAQELAEMELELATAQAELAGFGERYQTLITGRLAELDRLQAAIANEQLKYVPDNAQMRARAQQSEARAQQSQRERQQWQSQERPRPECERQQFNASDDLKKQFRQLAQQIHPDRARNDEDRSWRTQLMSEANQAYRNADAAALRRVYDLWQSAKDGATAQRSSGTNSAQDKLLDQTTLRLVAEAADMRQRIATISRELDRLYGSKLYELFTAARVAGGRGRDLLAEMARQLDEQIAQAQRDLENLHALAKAA